MKGRDRGEFLVVPKRFKKHVLHRFVHPTPQGGLNVGVGLALLAASEASLRVEGEGSGWAAGRAKTL